MAQQEDTIGQIQAHVSQKYEQQRETLESMHAENQKWLKEAVSKHMSDVAPSAPEIVVEVKETASSKKIANKENEGNQRGECDSHSSPE